MRRLSVPNRLFLSLLFCAASLPLRAQGVRVSTGTIEDRRTTGQFFGGLELELKLTGDDLADARAVRIQLSKAEDETGQDLLTERSQQGDFQDTSQTLKLSLKNPADYPVTFVWFSNGGRDYPPWNSRHFGVLGLEEGRAWSAYGHAASVAPNPLSEAGIPTSVTLTPGGSVALSHVVGGVPLPEGWAEVTSIEVVDGSLRLFGDDGKSVDHPFDTGFLRTGTG